MSSMPISHPEHTVEWHLPDKRRVGMTALIVGESAIFTSSLAMRRMVSASIAGTAMGSILVLGKGQPTT